MISGSTIRAHLISLVCLALLGCHKAPLEIVPVYGRITNGGGDWPAAGHVVFLPQTATRNRPVAPAQAAFERDGKFTARTGSRQGLVPGTYAVRIECWEVAPQMGRPGKSWVPERYQSGPTEDFVVEVPADATGPIEVAFDIPRRPW